MTIHFAAARPVVSATLGRRTVTLPIQIAANDNACDFANEAILRGALQLFAQHGLGAAVRACEAAEQAFRAGDEENYRWSLALCRALDRRMAVRLRASTGAFSY